jgi:hypothetical protein
LTCQFAPIQDVRCDLPGSLIQVVSRCLSRDPRDRYQQALLLRDALLAIDLG